MLLLFCLLMGCLSLQTAFAAEMTEINSDDSAQQTEDTLANAQVEGLALSSDGKGIILSWEVLEDAQSYRIYRGTTADTTKMTQIAETADLTYTDATTVAGVTYYYALVACGRSEEGLTICSKTSAVVAGLALDTPALGSATNTASGIKITWSTVTGAETYAVYRKTSGGSWKKLAEVTESSYVDAAAKAGTTYLYTVRACAVVDGVTLRSGYDRAGVSGSFLATPELDSAKKTASGTKLTWSQVSGATGYAVYRKKEGGSWSMIGTTTSASYTDKTSLSAGVTYSYTVRAYCGSLSSAKANKYLSSYWSSYDGSGLQSVGLDIPSLSGTATSTASGTKITWSKVSGASGYAVYRKKSGGSWSMIDTTTSTSYTDTSSRSSGATYYYTVRAYSGSLSLAKANKYAAAYWSYYDTAGVKAVYLSSPTLKTVAVASSSYVKVSWKSVTGADGYVVYRKTEGGSWKQIGTTTSTSYTDKTSLSSSTTYYYTVRAYRGSYAEATANKYKAAYWSGYDSTGLAFDYIKNSDGTLAWDADMHALAQSYSSDTSWLILVNCTTNKVAVFYGSCGSWSMKYYWSCSTGATSSPTVKGEYTVKAKGLSFGDGYTCWYYTQFYGNYLFHSVLYQTGSMTTLVDGRLGLNISHGCVRLSLANAKWIYDTIPTGTKVVSY